MSRLLRRSLVALIALLAAALSPSVAGAAEVVTAEYDTAGSNGAIWIYGANEFAGGFTAEQSGTLTRVALVIGAEYAPDADLRVTLRRLDGDALGAPIAEATVPRQGVPVDRSGSDRPPATSVSFPAGVSLRKGERYAVHLSAPTTSGRYTWHMNDTDLPGSFSFSKYSFHPEWSRLCTTDCVAFRLTAYVEPADETPPAITLTGPERTMLKPGDSEPVSFACVDDVDGAVPCTATTSQGDRIERFSEGSLPTGSEGGWLLRVEAQDRAGNRADRTVAYTVDGTSPTISHDLPPGLELQRGAQRSVSYSCADAHLRSCTATASNGDTRVGIAADGGVLPTGQDGVWTLVLTGTDHAGNETRETRTYLVDGEAPTVSLAVSGLDADGRVLIDGQARVSLACADEAGGSGLLAGSCRATLTAGGRTIAVGDGDLVDTSFVGARVVEAGAEDEVGNRGAARVDFSVIWPFAGWFSPVNALPTVNVVRAGSAVPVKFSLGGDRGLAVLAEGAPSSQATTCGADAAVDAIEEAASTDATGLTYEPDSERYKLVWKTRADWAGTCRQLVVRLADGTTHRASFRFR